MVSSRCRGGEEGNLEEAWPFRRSHVMIADAEKVFGNVLNLHTLT